MWTGIIVRGVVALHTGGTRAPADVFDNIYWVFLLLGTLVGVVVIGYTMYNALKYRAKGDDSTPKDESIVPGLGELPTGSGGGKKLFVSFFLSAVIVVTLVIWTYLALLYVESGPQETDMTVDVVGGQFSWTFVYPNGYKTDTLRVPVNHSVRLNVTSMDVMHNIGIPAFNAKTDAIPGQTTKTWLHPKQTGTFKAVCYELCGSGHSNMRSDVIVMPKQEYDQWYATLSESNGNTTAAVAGGD